MGIEVYPIEIKLAVVRYIVEEGHTQREAAEKYGVSLTSVAASAAGSFNTNEKRSSLLLLLFSIS